ncbi:hypothetical protein GS426_20885 [Rhodococcus hoagii]|nr:hypothetical protein [Prescottella equi]
MSAAMARCTSTMHERDCRRSNNPGWIYRASRLSEATLKRTASRNIGDGWYTFPNLVVDDY